MSNYFSYFPTVKHSLKDNGSTVEVTNILKRFAFRDSVGGDVDNFYEHSIEEGDRPDILADKLYGNSNYAWIILLFNDMVDPIYEWPLFGQDFTNFITAKYGSVTAANEKVQAYYKILYQGFTRIDSQVVKTKKVEVDLTTYNSLGSNDKSFDTAYEYEVELNDNRRKIRVLNSRYLNTVVDQAHTLLRSAT
tara:strand:- start:234 stop:809 length:576 start_codon:yes stop_codon:yes gene_type:complete